MKAWHFTTADMKLGYGDGRKIEDGKTLTVDCEPVLCHQGLHASKRLIDALTYAPGPVICRVELGGKVLHDEDKSVATERTCLWHVDATNLLHEFACSEALDALKAAKVTDKRCFDAIAAKRAWVKGEIGDAELDAAWDAARAAAWDAARAAARAAARDAARAAAWAAARAAAWDAARAAARAAARKKQNRRLTSMVMAEYRRINQCK